MRSGTIYLAEDDSDLRQVLSILISSWNWPVLSFDDGRPCLEAALADEPACLITDLDMPVMGGLELIHALRLHRPDLPIIVVSAACRDAEKAKLRDLHADLICKPFDVDDLHEHVKRAMN